jgi:hypothetical protein
MHSGYRYLTSLFLTVALASPLAIAQQDEHNRDADRHQEQDHNARDQQKFYDRSHHDYHQWNDNEDHAYRQYLAENHREYLDFQSASSRQKTSTGSGAMPILIKTTDPVTITNRRSSYLKPGTLAPVSTGKSSAETNSLLPALKLPMVAPI